jgi:hypothetical protein
LARKKGPFVRFIFRTKYWDQAGVKNRPDFHLESVWLTVCRNPSKHEPPRNFLGIAPEIRTLAKGKTGGCTLLTMMRVLTTGLAIVVILSCATILITPDAVDDINGILHQHHSVRAHKLLAATPAQLRPFVLATFQSFNPLIQPFHSSTPRLLALVCVRLC